MARRLARVLGLFILVFVFTLVAFGAARGQDFTVGQDVTFVVRLHDDGSDRRIPLHLSAGDSRTSDRLPSGSRGTIIELGVAPHTNWLKVRASSVEGWVITKYVASVVPSGAQPPPAATAALEYVVGCWNLEHFHQGTSRGFPENGNGGPSYPERTQAQVQEIATAITGTLNARLLVLNEINGFTGQDADGDAIPLSHELQGLLDELPSEWDYILTWSGDAQRIAILYDGSVVRINDVVELTVAPRRIEGKDIFERDPLAVHLSLLENGQPRNDLVVVGVHLASGQSNEQNHNEAMRVLLQRLHDTQADGELGGSSEQDVLFLGDFNANMFRPPVEEFFIDMDEVDGAWDVLADPDYPSTRLKGVPLALTTDNQIDYIIASRFGGSRTGLSGQEIPAGTASVHVELVTAQGGADSYRRDLSDHLPVTVAVRVEQDGD